MAVLRNGRAKGDAVAALALVGIFKVVYLLGEHEVGLASGKGVGLQLLTIEIGANTQPTLGAYLAYAVGNNREDAAGAASAVVNLVCGVFELPCYGKHCKVGKQVNVVAGRKVLSCLGHIVFLVEAT